MVADIPKESVCVCVCVCVCAFTYRIYIYTCFQSCCISVCFTFRRRTWSTNCSRYWCHATSLYLLQSPPSIAFPAPTLEVASHWGYWSWKVGISALCCLTVTPALVWCVGVETSEKWASEHIQHLLWPKLAIRSVELNGKHRCIIIVQHLPWPKAAFVSVQGWW